MLAENPVSAEAAGPAAKVDVTNLQTRGLDKKPTVLDPFLGHVHQEAAYPQVVDTTVVFQARPEQKRLQSL